MSISSFIDIVENFGSLTQIEQVKLVAYFYCVANNKNDFNSTEIKECFVSENLRAPTNVSHYFAKLSEGKNPTFIKKGNTVTFHRTIKKELDDIYIVNKHSQNTSTTLRSLLPKVTSTQQSTFLEETISCFEIKCYRASVIMTWLLTMEAIYEMVLNSYLADFNAAIQSHGKYKKSIIVRKEDFADIKESDFIELLRVGKIISGDIRKILLEKLDFRNTAAHPNTIIIKETKAISFIEDLVENVIFKIQ